MLTLRNTTAAEMRVRASLQGQARVPQPGGRGPDFTTLPLSFPPQDLVLPAGAARASDAPGGAPLQARLDFAGESGDDGGP
jgi:hypothetical protein